MHRDEWRGACGAPLHTSDSTSSVTDGSPATLVEIMASFAMAVCAHFAPMPYRPNLPVANLTSYSTLETLDAWSSGPGTTTCTCVRTVGRCARTYQQTLVGGQTCATFHPLSSKRDAEKRHVHRVFRPSANKATYRGRYSDCPSSNWLGPPLTRAEDRPLPKSLMMRAL